MKVLVFDTETTGLPIGKNPSIYEMDKWPYIVQLSYIFYDTETKRTLECGDDIIKIPEKVVVSPESIAIHKITPAHCKELGVPIKEAFARFNNCLQECDIVVGHNISFDKRLIMVESMRNQIKQYFTIMGERKPEYCSMKNTIDLCKISVIGQTGIEYFKYPKLSELHKHLFNVVPEGLHNALADVLICLRCYVSIEHNYDITTDSNALLISMYNAYCSL